MSRRVWRAVVVLAVADLVCFALTIHAHLSFHRAPGGPSSMNLGQVLGWSVSVALLLLIVVVVREVRPTSRTRARRTGRRSP